MTSRSLGHRAPLLWLVLPLIAGIIAGRYGPPARPVWLLAGALAAALLSVLAAWRAPRVWALALGAALLLAGDASYTLRRARLAAWEQLPPREAQLGRGPCGSRIDARRTRDLRRRIGRPPPRRSGRHAADSLRARKRRGEHSREQRGPGLDNRAAIRSVHVRCDSR